MFEGMLARNPVLAMVLDRAADVGLPGWHLTAGCLVQTVWNVLHGFPPTYGIRDYDLFYFDDRDTSWEAEDAVVQECARAFTGVPAAVEVRNQARVHLWYPAKFGLPCDPFRTCEDGIDSFPVMTCCVGTRRVGTGLSTYAPHGFEDLLNLVVRPHAARPLRAVYEAKTRRWSEAWPGLRVIPWPAE